MSVSILEVIESAGYDLSTYDDAQWLLSQQSQFNDLIDEAEKTIDDKEFDNE
jgi:hypothetical protein